MTYHSNNHRRPESCLYKSASNNASLHNQLDSIVERILKSQSVEEAQSSHYNSALLRESNYLLKSVNDISTLCRFLKSLLTTFEKPSIMLIVSAMSNPHVDSLEDFTTLIKEVMSAEVCLHDAKNPNANRTWESWKNEAPRKTYTIALEAFFHPPSPFSQQRLFPPHSPPKKKENFLRIVAGQKFNRVINNLNNHQIKEERTFSHILQFIQNPIILSSYTVNVIFKRLEILITPSNEKKTILENREHLDKIIRLFSSLLSNYHNEFIQEKDSPLAHNITAAFNRLNKIFIEDEETFINAAEKMLKTLQSFRFDEQLIVYLSSIFSLASSKKNNQLMQDAVHLFDDLMRIEARSISKEKFKEEVLYLSKAQDGSLVYKIKKENKQLIEGEIPFQELRRIDPRFPVNWERVDELEPHLKFIVSLLKRGHTPGCSSISRNDRILKNEFSKLCAAIFATETTIETITEVFNIWEKHYTLCFQENSSADLLFFTRLVSALQAAYTRKLPRKNKSRYYKERRTASTKRFLRKRIIKDYHRRIIDFLKSKASLSSMKDYLKNLVENPELLYSTCSFKRIRSHVRLSDKEELSIISGELLIVRESLSRKRQVYIYYLAINRLTKERGIAKKILSLGDSEGFLKNYPFNKKIPIYNKINQNKAFSTLGKHGIVPGLEFSFLTLFTKLLSLLSYDATTRPIALELANIASTSTLKEKFLNHPYFSTNILILLCLDNQRSKKGQIQEIFRALPPNITLSAALHLFAYLCHHEPIESQQLKFKDLFERIEKSETITEGLTFFRLFCDSAEAYYKETLNKAPLQFLLTRYKGKIFSSHAWESYFLYIQYIDDTGEALEAALSSSSKRVLKTPILRALVDLCIKEEDPLLLEQENNNKFLSLIKNLITFHFVSSRSTQRDSLESITVGK